MSTDQITIVITSYKSDEKITKCLKSINNECKTIIIENSKNISFKENIEKKYNPKNTAIWDLIPKGESVLRNKDLQKQIIEQLKKVKYEN